VKDDERRLFAVPALSGQFDGIELSFLDPDDEHDRTILVLAEHPELRSAIESGRDKIHHHGRVVNPQLHLAMHEIVANQLLANEPPEMWDTAKRLTGAGYERHEVLHMLASIGRCCVVRSGVKLKPFRCRFGQIIEASSSNAAAQRRRLARASMPSS
jgi:uncharacterized protein DUF1841